MNEAEQIATKVSRDFAKLKQFVQGNGTKEGCLAERVNILEIRSKKILGRVEVVEGYPCQNGCIFLENEKTEEEMQTRNRNFRIGDLANIIQLAVLALIVYGMFF